MEVATIHALNASALDKIWISQQRIREQHARRRRYYYGDNDITQRNARHADGRLKANVPTGFAGYVVEMYVGAMTGTPYQLTGAQNIYDEIAFDADLQAVDTENLRNALICGYGLELHEYVDKKPRVLPEKPEHWALIRDENDEIVAALTRFEIPAYTYFRGQLLDSAIDVMYYYDDSKRVAYWRTKPSLHSASAGNWEQLEERPHYYGAVPLVEWRGNDAMRPLLDNAVLKQIDEYDEIDSLSGDDIRNVSDALLKIKGISGQWIKDNEDVILRMRVLPLPDDADADYLTRNTDTERVSVRLARTRDAIHLMAGVPDIQQVVGATGNTSGIALKLKFMPMQQRAEAMFKELRKGMRRRIDLLNSMVGKAAQKTIADYEIHMQFNMPVNRIEEWQYIGNLNGIVSHETQLALLTDIDNPEHELDKLREDEVNNASVRAITEGPEIQAARQDVQVARAVPQMDAQIQTSIDLIGDRILAAVTRTNR